MTSEWYHAAFSFCNDLFALVAVMLRGFIFPYLGKYYCELGICFYMFVAEPPTLISLFQFIINYKQKSRKRLTNNRLRLDSCGGRTRTCDLQVMSLASYQLLHSAILTIAIRLTVEVFLNCECKGMTFYWNLQMFLRLFFKNDAKRLKNNAERLLSDAEKAKKRCRKG